MTDDQPTGTEPSEVLVHQALDSGIRRRNFDMLTALLLAVIASPALLWLALRARSRHGRVFDREPVIGAHGKIFRLRKFAGLSAGREFALVFNVLVGDLAWVGSKAQSVHLSDNATRDDASEPEQAQNRREAQTPSNAPVLRPGLICQRRLQRLTGTYYEEHDRRVSQRDFGIMRSLSIVARYLIARAMAPSYGARCPDQFNMLDVTIHNHSTESALAVVAHGVAGNTPTRVGFVNPDCLNIAADNPEYRDILNNMDCVFADGIGLQIGARMLGFQLKANINGTDLFPMLCNQCARAGHSIFMLGGAEGVAQQAADNMTEKFPDLNIVGTHHGYFDKNDSAPIVDMINASGADILLVAFGAPHQEAWIAQHENELCTGVNMGVGGLFDFYAERISRSPRWLRDIGLEWTWRLLQEPRRMWRRYILGNPLFLLRVWMQARQDPSRKILKKFSLPTLSIAKSSSRYRFRHIAHSSMLLLSRAMRRGIDITVSVSAMIALSPLLLAVVFMIKRESPGPVFFSQQRIGKWGRYFRMYKFRSMYIDAEERKQALIDQNEMEGGVLFKMKEDPRITRTGRFIRKYSIDELPQLWNVAIGDMALVGPRPPVQSEVDQYSLADRRRLEIKPGITCIWQVSGRSEIPFDEQVELDVDYIESHGVWQDIKILLKTVPAVLQGKGAY